MTAKQNFEMSSDMPSEADRLLESNSHTVWIAGASWVCDSHSSYSFHVTLYRLTADFWSYGSLLFVELRRWGIHNRFVGKNWNCWR
jgi:hypothetical protein